MYYDFYLGLVQFDYLQFPNTRCPRTRRQHIREGMVSWPRFLRFCLIHGNTADVCYWTWSGFIFIGRDVAFHTRAN